MRSGSATEVPPNFWTTRATGGQVTGAHQGSRTTCAVPRHWLWRRVACAVMAKRSNARAKERAAASAEVRRRAAERTERRRRVIAIVAVVVVLMAVFGAIVAAANDKG